MYSLQNVQHHNILASINYQFEHCLTISPNVDFIYFWWIIYLKKQWNCFVTSHCCIGQVFVVSQFKFSKPAVRYTSCRFFCLRLPKVKNYKATLARGHWGPQCCKTSRIPHFSIQSAHRLRWSCQLHVPAAHYHQEHFWYSFQLEPVSILGP